MPVRIFTISFDPNQEIFQDEAFSRFLLNKHVKRLQPEFFQMNGHAFWTIFVEYENISETGKKDTEGLDEAQRLLFHRLREWRSERAEKDGIPVFIIATNKQLVDITIKSPVAIESLREINGFGKKKVDRYGNDILEIIKAFNEKKPVRNFKAAAKSKRTESFSAEKEKKS